jgi:hypothetical protein
MADSLLATSGWLHQLECGACGGVGRLLASQLVLTAGVCTALLLQEDLSETTPAVGALCKLLLSDQLQEIQQFVPQIVQVGAAG